MVARRQGLEGRVLLGRIGAPHGVKGEIRLTTFTGEPAAIADYGPLTTGDGRRLRLQWLRQDGKGTVATFVGVTSREAAAALRGAELFVARQALPPVDAEDEFYQADLVGLTATKTSGAELGIVIAVHDHGAGAVLEVAPQEGESLLVPFTRAAVPEIDVEAGRIVIDLPAEAEAPGEIDGEIGKGEAT